MSSLKDLASLIMIPSLVKDGRLDTVKPLGNSIIHPDATGNNDGTDGSTPAEGNFTFSRGSNLAATRVDVNGLIEKGRENVLKYSNDFSQSVWFKSDVVVSGTRVADPFGGNTAWSVNFGNTTYSRIEQNVSSTSGIKTQSVWVRVPSGTKDFIIGFSGGEYVTKTATTDWQRFETFTPSGSGFPRVLCEDSATLEIYGFQAELGLVATDYIETGASTAQAGILEDLPRLDYSGGASCPSLLLEPQRTNIIESSEYLEHSSWILGRMTQLSNQTISPEGIQNATLIANTTETGNHNIGNSLGSYTNASLAVSFYAKKKDNDYLQFGIYNSSTKWAAQKINLATGAKLGSGNTGFHDAPSGVSVTDVGNDWWRVEALFTTTLTGATETFYLAPTPTDANPTGTFGLYGGWTGATTENAYIYGVQVESGVSYPTSYIPTMGSAVTRSADDMTTTFGSALATNGSVTIFYHDLGVPDSDDINTTSASYRYEASTGNYVSLTTNDDSWRLRVQGGSSSNFKGLNDHPKTSPIKVAVIVSSTHYSIFANGVKEVDNESLVATGDFSSIQKFNTNIQDSVGVRRAVQHLVFPTALTDAECIALTTI